MGGNALAPFGARRYERDEYLVLRDKIMVQLGLHVSGVRNFREIPSMTEKESYGDLDILCTELTPENYEEIKRLAGNTPFVRNSEVLSVLWEELQVDIIPMPHDDFETALVYYSYNDLGNLMSKIYHKFGLKYGHRGLTMPMRDGNNQYDELIVSKRPIDIFSFIGLDWRKFQAGFKNRDEIFRYVISSRFFNPEIYSYENLNAHNRIRDRKRETYREFLKYVVDKPANHIFEEEDKNHYLPMLFNFFPSLKVRYDISNEKLARRRAVRDKLNGDKVSAWTGLTGTDLGQLMEFMKKTYGVFDKWVLDLEDSELESLVKTTFSNFELRR